MTEPPEKIVIRCDYSLKKRFRIFVAEKGFRNYREALDYLLRKEEERVRIK